MTNNQKYFDNMKNRIFAMNNRGYTIQEISYVIMLSEELVEQILNTYKKEIVK